MIPTLRLGLRLALGGGREGLARLVFMATGIGVGVALLLLTATAPAAIRARLERVAWHDAAYSAMSPETEDDPVAESAAGALFLAVSDYYDGRPMTRSYLAALGADPPVPPSLPRAPGPGEVAASPAMIRLLGSTPDGELDDRFPGRVNLTIGPEGLGHDRELVAIIGRTPEQLTGVRSVGEVHGFDRVRPTGWAINAALALFVLAGSMLVLAPVVVLLVTVSRVATRRRERRLAAIRLVGATQSQIAVVAAVEVGLAAVAGAALGWAVYEVVRRVLAATVVFQYGHFWAEDLAVPPWWLAGILLGTPVLVMLTAVLALRPVLARPLAVQRQAARRRPSLWTALPLIVGLGGQFVILPFREQLAVPAGDGARPPIETVGALLTLLTLVGFVLVGPWLVATAGRGLARVSRGVPSLLAARRIAEHPQATFLAVAAVGLSATALAYLGCAVSVGPAGVDRPEPRSLRPGVVSVMTGGVPATVVEPLLSAGGVARTAAGADVACVDRARVENVTCPYPPGSGFTEPAAGTRPPSTVDLLDLPTDGSLAAENAARTRVAKLVPNAIVNSSRDPVDVGLETFFRDVDRLAAIAALFVLFVGAFGLTTAMVAGLVDRRRSFTLLRASGVHLSELRRTVLLETAATMAAVSVAGAGVGMLLAYGSSRQGGVDWRWPGPELWAFIGGGVLAALLFSTLALPLLSLTTRPDAVRFE